MRFPDYVPAASVDPGSPVSPGPPGMAAVGPEERHQQMPYARTRIRAETCALRDKMRALGLGYQEISAEFAAQINAYTGDVGLDPGGIAAMTGSHLCEYENWPGRGPGRPGAGHRRTCSPFSPAQRIARSPRPQISRD